MAVNTSRQGKIVTFWSGGKAGTGVTSTAFYIAQILKTKFRVVLVDINLKSPQLAEFLTGSLDNENLTIDTLKPLITRGYIRPDEIFGKTVADKTNGNLRYLLGTNFPFKLGFSSGEIDMILEALQEKFDLVLVDVCAYPDNPGTLSALAKADQIVLVVEQDISCLKLFGLWKICLGELPLNENVVTVINKYDTENSLTRTYIEDFFNAKAGYCLPTINISAGKSSCLSLDEIASPKKIIKDYKRELYRLGETITGQPLLDQNTKKRFSVKNLINPVKVKLLRGVRG